MKQNKAALCDVGGAVIKLVQLTKHGQFSVLTENDKSFLLTLAYAVVLKRRLTDNDK